MSSGATLTVASTEYSRLLAHLVRDNPEAEEAAFVLAQPEGPNLRLIESYLVPENEFVYRSLYHIELTDGCRAKTIKRAHDLGACVVELHSHPLARLASFSLSDRSGFSEFVPHVMWRLKGRPYGAIVVARGCFDSLFWPVAAQVAEGTIDLVVDGRVLRPTGTTLRAMQNGHEDTND